MKLSLRMSLLFASHFPLELKRWLVWVDARARHSRNPFDLSKISPRGFLSLLLNSLECFEVPETECWEPRSGSFLEQTEIGQGWGNWMAFQYETHAWLLKGSFSCLEAETTIWVPTFIRSHLLVQICIEIANGRTTTSVCRKRWAKFSYMPRKWAFSLWLDILTHHA